jgi:hypothetical protein
MSIAAKLLEVRDIGTFIPVLAVKMVSDDDQEKWLASTAGYGQTQEERGPCVVLCRIAGGEGKCACDPYDWGQNPRTMRFAHQHIATHFDELAPGAVVDVEHILGERAEPKTSDRFWRPNAAAQEVR